VEVRGTFPSPCYVLRRIELVPSIATVIGPPKLRILVDDQACTLRICPAVLTPWSARLLMPALPPGNFRLPIEAAVVSCSDSFPSDTSVRRASHPFVVVPSCPEQPYCYTHNWQGDQDGSGCDAMVSPGRPGRVTLRVNSSQFMAGLQGDLALYSPYLRIANLEAVGVAGRMQLQWRRTPVGARFVMFAPRGGSIPPYDRDDFPGGWPVLAVTVEWAAPNALPTPGRASLVLQNALASDSLGRQIPPCVVNMRDPAPMATICVGARCDLNADGAADVRDLVLMVRCVTEDCTTAVDLDCNRDGLVQLEDVLCCAHYVLASDAFDTTAVRAEPDVRVTFGAPRDVAGGIDVPLVLRAADRVGGARLALAYPAEAFEVLGVEVAGGSEWLDLHEVRDGKIVIGLIALGGPDPTATDLPMTVRLAPRPGRTASGVVRLLESEFSGRDGVHLGVDTGHPATELRVAPRLTLSAGRPNPFATTTRFAVEVAGAGALDVAVYDLHGRHVKSLYRGAVTPGPQEFAWDGQGADGRRQPSGVYFVRASLAGSVVTRRVVLLSTR
jgi:hypothetical protein